MLNLFTHTGGAKKARVMANMKGKTTNVTFDTYGKFVKNVTLLFHGMIFEDIYIILYTTL